jgi:hypothetical protein
MGKGNHHSPKPKNLIPKSALKLEKEITNGKDGKARKANRLDKV